MKPSSKISRRSALKAGLAAAAVPTILPSRLFGDVVPSEQITIGFIGVGWQGGSNLGEFLKHKDCKVLAIADVDQKHLQSTVERVNKQYKNSDCKGYKDFRELLGRKDIDAVCISTPDHWHCICAVEAARAKKDIFCEKPLSHTLAEGIAMVDAVKQAGRIWQTGSWQRSVANFRQGTELVINGYIGKIKKIEVGLPGGHTDFERSGRDLPNSAPPPEVDYDFWVGPAEMVPFNPARFHKNWRWSYNFGGGQLLDWIGHHGDIAHWGLTNPKYGIGPDDQVGPLEVKATADFPPPAAIWNTATKFRVDCKYPNDIELVISGGHADIRGGTKWIGEHGWVWVDRGRFETSDPKWKEEIIAREKKGDLDMALSASPGHQREFLNSVKSRKRTLTPIEIAHRSQTPGHLGYIASMVGRTLKWDAAKQEIIGDEAATKLMSKPMRAPWHL
jgi:predicted dehydrogenase